MHELVHDDTSIVSGIAHDVRAHDAHATTTSELPASWSEPFSCSYGLSRAAIPELVNNAQRSSRMQGNPIVLSRDELTQTLEAAP
jgi:alcohol dehydrogenase class IV